MPALRKPQRARAHRPHVLGIDDGPFEKGQAAPVPLVAVMMEGARLVEAVAFGALPVDAPDATEQLARFVETRRAFAATRALVLGGITIAGLGVVDVDELAARVERPVLVTNRRDPALSRLDAALVAAGLEERRARVARTPRAERIDGAIWLAWAGTDRSRAVALLRACRGKALLPEPLRVAHLIARALVLGESRGRV